MPMGVRSHSLRLVFTLRLDRFGTNWSRRDLEDATRTSRRQSRALRGRFRRSSSRGGLREGELSAPEAEKIHLLLDLERTKLAKAIYAARRRLAQKLGFSGNDVGCEPLDVDLAELRDAYRERARARSCGVAVRST